MNPNQTLAFERLVLLCERIKITNLISREAPSGVSALAYQQHLIQVIRQEFNHNLAQQIYVSSPAWLHISTLVETTIQYIFQNQNSQSFNQTDADFAKTLIQGLTGGNIPKNQEAIDFLKSEFRA